MSPSIGHIPASVLDAEIWRLPASVVQCISTFLKLLEHILPRLELAALLVDHGFRGLGDEFLVAELALGPGDVALHTLDLLVDALPLLVKIYQGSQGDECLRLLGDDVHVALEDLNNGIQRLNDVLAPIAKFFNIFN